MAAKQNYEDDVVCDQQRWHPEGRYPVCRSHVRRCFEVSREKDGRRKIERPFDIEHPDQHAGAAMVAQHGGDRSQGKQRRRKITERGRKREFLRNTGLDCARRHKH